MTEPVCTYDPPPENAIETLAQRAALAKHCGEATPFREEEPLAEALAEMADEGIPVPSIENALKVVLDEIACAEDVRLELHYKGQARLAADSESVPRVVGASTVERLILGAIVARWSERRGEQDASSWMAKYEYRRMRLALETGSLYDALSGLTAEKMRRVPDQLVELWRGELNSFDEAAQVVTLIRGALDEARVDFPVAVKNIERNRMSAWSRFREFVHGPASSHVWIEFNGRHHALCSAPSARMRLLVGAREPRRGGTHRRGSRRGAARQSSSSDEPGGSDPDAEVGAPPANGGADQ